MFALSRRRKDTIVIMFLRGSIILTGLINSATFRLWLGVLGGKGALNFARVPATVAGDMCSLWVGTMDVC